MSETISAKKSALGDSEVLLPHSNRELQQLLNAMQSVVLYLDRSGCVVHGNTRAQVWNQGRALEGCFIGDLVAHWQLAEVDNLRHHIAQVASSGKPAKGFERRVVELGKNVWYHVDIQPTTDEGGAIGGVLLILSDVSERHRNYARLEHLATHDPLTGLPNRALLYERIEHFIVTRRDHQQMALLLVDLDSFKEINDTLGHLEGDKVLKQLGPRLKAELGDINGVIARLGGDEFAIFLPNIRNTQQAVVMGHRFLDAICQVFELGGLRTELSASVGVAIAPDQASDVSTLMRFADIAMYHAKKELKGVAVYDASYDPHSPKRLELMGALGSAIREDQLSLHFQPKVCLRDNRVYGFEALLRWTHPEIGVISPAEFIPIAEKLSVIHPMTYWVMEQAIKQSAKWRSEGRDVTVAMNLSARNLLDDDIAADLEKLLRRYNLPGSCLEMEITESMIMADPLRAQRALEKISAQGVKLAVDDFGTGYSSLAYLKRLPVQTLKIDASFVQGMLDDEQDEIIVNSTVQLAHNLGLKVVAEGVECEVVCNKLRDMGCDDAQGYYIARPMASDAVARWLLEKNQWSST